MPDLMLAYGIAAAAPMLVAHSSKQADLYCLPLARGAACKSRNRMRAGYLSMEELEMQH